TESAAWLMRGSEDPEGPVPAEGGGQPPEAAGSGSHRILSVRKAMSVPPVRRAGRSRRGLTACVLALSTVLGGLSAVASSAPAAADEPCANGYVAITFDDGPTTLTPDYVQALHDAGWVRATFFLEGSHALDYPSYVDLLAQNGHWIGNHTYSHPFLDTLSTT